MTLSKKLLILFVLLWLLVFVLPRFFRLEGTFGKEKAVPPSSREGSHGEH